MFKKAILPLGIIIAGVFTISMLVVARPKPMANPIDEGAAYVKVEVVPAQQQVVRLSVSTQGTVIPKREIDVVAQVSGQVMSAEPAFVDGGFFSKSQQLIQIDDSDYKIALLTAKSRLADAQRRLAEEQGLARQAKREWRDLGNQNSNDLFVRKPQMEAAKANLASAKGDVAMAELNLERTKIVVPFDGRVKQTYADLGQYVTKGSRLATVYDSAAVEVRLPLTEKQASLINLPLTALSTEEFSASVLPAVEITGSVAGQVHQWQGVLVRTDAFVDSNSRLYYAVVEVANPFAQAPLLPGLFVEAVITGKELDRVLVLPRAALYQRNQILTLDTDNKISSHTVRVLRKSDSQVWVQAELADNTRISIEKQSLTPSGSIVEPIQSKESEADSSEISTKEKG